MATESAEDKIKALEKTLAEERAHSAAIEKELAVLNAEMTSSITSQKRFTEHLERLVVERTQEASQARDEALAASKAKSEFLATMSHEIRTPMNAIVGFTELLLKSSLTEKQRGHVSNIDVSGRNLLQIINDILDFSKIEAGKLDLEYIDFNVFELCEQIEAIYLTQAKEKGLELSFILDHKIPQTLHGDSLRINQIITNLISNALKFTSKGSITLMARLLSKDDDNCEVEFSCQDTGIGILPSVQEKLFSAFTQADGSTTRQYGGTGLGLSICRKLVEKMNGDIWVESQMGHGSNFKFRVTLAVPQNQQAQSTQQISRDEHQSFAEMNVLLVEDNEINQELAMELLASVDVKPDLAQNGLEALENVKIKNYDLVFMDIQMPLMDGLQTVRRIREDFKDRDIYVVAMTANASNEDRKNCMEAGMNDFISKPISLQAISKVLAERQQQLLGAERQPQSAFSASFSAGQAQPSDQQIEAPANDIQVFNTEAALQMMGNREPLLQRMLGMFLDKYKDADAQLEELVKQESWQEAQRFAHTVKGVASNVGAEELKQAVYDLEMEFKSILGGGQESTLTPLQTFFSYALERFCAAAAAYQAS